MNEQLEQQIDELRACFVESEFASHWALITGYHHAGELIKSINMKSQDLAEKVGRSQRTIEYAIKLYEKFPRLDALPEGKNITMNKLITKYLTAPKDKEDHICTPITICSSCKKKYDSAE